MTEGAKYKRQARTESFFSIDYNVILYMFYVFNFVDIKWSKKGKMENPSTVPELIEFVILPKQQPCSHLETRFLFEQLTYFSHVPAGTVYTFSVILARDSYQVTFITTTEKHGGTDHG